MHPSTSSSVLSPIQPFRALIENTEDALVILEAARQGLIPKCKRRMTEMEKTAYTRSGSVFVYTYEESGVSRWTDGINRWSPSRILGNFLVYREACRTFVRGPDDTQRGEAFRSGGGTRRVASQRPQHSRTKSEVSSDGGHSSSNSPSPPAVDMTLFQRDSIESLYEAVLRGPLSAPDKFAPGSLIKKTFSLPVAVPDPDSPGSMKIMNHHLVCYYTLEEAMSGTLPRPRDADDRLRHLMIGEDILKGPLSIKPTLRQAGNILAYAYTKGDSDDPESSYFIEKQRMARRNDQRNSSRNMFVIPNHSKSALSATAPNHYGVPSMTVPGYPTMSTSGYYTSPPQPPVSPPSLLAQPPRVASLPDMSPYGNDRQYPLKSIETPYMGLGQQPIQPPTLPRTASYHSFTPGYQAEDNHNYYPVSTSLPSTVANSEQSYHGQQAAGGYPVQPTNSQMYTAHSLDSHAQHANWLAESHWEAASTPALSSASFPSSSVYGGTPTSADHRVAGFVGYEEYAQYTQPSSYGSGHHIPGSHQQQYYS